MNAHQRRKIVRYGRRVAEKHTPKVAAHVHTFHVAMYVCSAYPQGKRSIHRNSRAWKRYFAWWRRLKARPDVVAFRAREAATGWTATVTTWQMTEGGAIIAFASKPLDYYGHGTAP